MITLTTEQAQQIEEALKLAIRTSYSEHNNIKFEASLSTIRATIAPELPHLDDEAVDRFAVAMKAKLAKKRAEGRGGWEDKNQCSAELLNQLLNEHIGKGDPVDVGNLAMMLWNRGEHTEARAQADHIADAGKMIGCAYCNNPLFAETKCNNCGRVTLAEQAEQEPVAYLRMGSDQRFVVTKAAEELVADKFHELYTYPVRTKDLTVSELDAIIEKHYDDEMDLKAMILDGIAADRMKNK